MFSRASYFIVGKGYEAGLFCRLVFSLYDKNISYTTPTDIF
jgi:hypothetical protein